MVPRPATAASPKSLLDMQTAGSQPRSTESKALHRGPAVRVLTSPPGDSDGPYGLRCWVTSRQTSAGIACLDYYIVDPSRRERDWRRESLSELPPLISVLLGWGLGTGEGDVPDSPVLSLHVPGGWR